MTTTTPLAPRTESETFSISLQLLGGYAFRVQFDDDLDDLITDETGPLGDDRGPSPSRLLTAAVANCLGASLVHCLRKGRVQIKKLEVSAITTLARNEQGRLRIERIVVLIDPDIPAEQRDRLQRCTSLFEDYCIVTESVRHGIDVRVSVTTG